MDYNVLQSRITDLLSQTTTNLKGMKELHRELEVANAHLILANKDDKILKDVEFLLRSAVYLTDIGQPNDWKLQLEAANAILNKANDLLNNGTEFCKEKR